MDNEQTTDSSTRDVAAQEVSAADPRGFHITRHNQIRRTYAAPSRTHAVARATYDDAQADDYADLHLAENSPVAQIGDFAREVNRSAGENIFGDFATADQVIAAIAQRVRDRSERGQ